jgi:hypothetical protein
MTRQYLTMFALALGASSFLSGCSSDVKLNPGGSGGSGTGGAPGAAGTNGIGGAGDAGAASFVFPDSLNPQAVIVPSLGPEASSQLLVGGTDYKTTEIASLNLGTGKVGNSEVYADGDAVPVSSAGIGFALLRQTDKVSLLDSGKISTTFDLKDPGTDTAPVDSKAYVPFLNQSLIAILDLSEGKVSRRIDLNEFNAPGDQDHSSEIVDGVYDPNQKIVYFMLQRIDLLALATDPDFHLHCTAAKALIVGIDAVHDTITDLNGSAAGKAIELSLANPSSISINADGTSLYLSAAGCYDGNQLAKQGVEVVDLTDGTSTVRYAPAAGGDGLTRLIPIGGSEALIKTQDASFASHWFKLDIAAGTVQGAEMKDVPDALTFDGSDLLGVQVTGKVGAVVRYEIASATATVISKTSWAGDYATASGSALVQ